MNWNTKMGSTIERIVNRPSAAYLVRGGDMTVLVDTGNAHCGKRLLSGLEGIDRIDHLVITHAHHDHVSNVYAVVERFHSKVLSHRSNEVLLKAGKNSPIKGTNAMIRALLSVVDGPFLTVNKYDPLNVDVSIDEDMVLNDHVELIHTPGHTEGSISVIVDSEIALVGDLMFGVLPRSVMPPFGESLVQLRESWMKVLDTGCSLMLPAHGGPITADRLRHYMR